MHSKCNVFTNNVSLFLKFETLLKPPIDTPNNQVNKLSPIFVRVRNSLYTKNKPNISSKHYRTQYSQFTGPSAV